MKTKIFLALLFISLLFGILFLKNGPLFYQSNISIPTLKINEPVVTTSPETKTVIYTEDGFNPAVTMIKPGDTIIFKNQSKKKLILAQSATSSIPVAKGKSYLQTYGEIGTIAIGDAMNPKVFGVIVVK